MSARAPRNTQERGELRQDDCDGELGIGEARRAGHESGEHRRAMVSFACARGGPRGLIGALVHAVSACEQVFVYSVRLEDLEAADAENAQRHDNNDTSEA